MPPTAGTFDAGTFDAGTFDAEDRLPRVPLPTLAESCGRFLDWCAPLLDDAALATTRDAVAAFLRPDSPAHDLQAALEELDRTPGVTSWLDAFWSDRYLGRRDRIALNANYFFLFDQSGSDQSGSDQSGLGQVERAADLVAAAVRVKLAADSGTLVPATQRGQPLSMHQYLSLFSACRIPGEVTDTVRSTRSPHRPTPADARHVVVLHHGHLFRMDVLTAAGHPHHPTELAAGLREVIAASPFPADPATAVAQLTTTARAEWAVNRQALLTRDPRNAAALDVIESALCCVCLDDATPTTVHEAGDQLLHGGAGNRWYDKPLSLVVFADGAAGLNGEHAELDGTTVVALIEALLAQSPAPHKDPADQPPGAPTVEALRFSLDPTLTATIGAAAEDFAAAVADTASTVVSIGELGADTVKALHTSPDAFVQMAYQLAHTRARGFVGSTYESIATRTFRHGRTEAMRVVTPQSVRFVTAMDDPTSDRSAREAAYRAAADAHTARARDCQAGKAPEQHLWELELLQRRRRASSPASSPADGTDPPLALHASPGWHTMRTDYLSTSSAASPAIACFGFGSTNPRCIGVGYVLRPDRLILYLSSHRTVADQLQAFARELVAAIHQMRDLLTT